MGKELGEEQRMGAVESPGERRGAEAEYVRILFGWVSSLCVQVARREG